MAKIDQQLIDEIRAAVAGLRGQHARRILADFAGRFQVSAGYLYRLTASARGGTRHRRRDQGVRRIALPSEVHEFMRAMTRQADLSADTILFATARHFGLAADFMTATTYNNWLRQERLSRHDIQTDLRPYRAFESPRANHMHHYDTTVAEAYYANDDDTIGYEAPHARYKNKPGNRKPRIILYAMVDDHSRVLFARFYFSENALNLLDFVLRSWSQSDDKRFPAYGIPDHLYADKGAPQRSEKFLHAMRVLGVHLPDSTPSHSEPFGSRKHGKVERTFGEGLLGEFMKLTKIYTFSSLDEMNATLWEWLIHVNNRVQRVTGEVRFARWLRTVGTPRSMPSAALFNLLRYTRDTRVVSRNLQIALNGKTFQLPYRRPFLNWVGAKVEVYWVPGHEETISIVYDHHEEELSAMPLVVDTALDYKRAPQTDHETRRAALDEVNFSKLNVPALWNDTLTYLPKKGEKFDDTKIAAKVVEQPDGTTRPSFAPMRWLTRGEVRADLAKLDLMSDDGKLSEAEITLLATIMQGRPTISEDELTTHITTLRATRRTGTEG